MSIKKKLGMGVATAALGLTLVGGGTWAAFNDTATINNHFAAGTLDLEVGHVNQGANFDLGNMKPGDSVKRLFTLNNKGSLAIKEVLMQTTAGNFKDNGAESTVNADLLDYLSQFEINVMRADNESPNNTDPTDDRWEPSVSIVKNGEKLTLKDLVDGGYVSKIKTDYLADAYDPNNQDSDKRINLAPLVVAPGSEGYRGIPVNPEDSDAIIMEITFKNDRTKKDNGEYVQNKFQNDSAHFFFNLEATQWDGMKLDSSHGSGDINNGVQGSSDGTNSPGTKVINGSSAKYKDNEVEDVAGDNRD